MTTTDIRPAHVQETVRTIEHRVTTWLARHSIDVLRVSLGIVFLTFGALKFVPGASPAADLVVRTIDGLTFGIVPAPGALLAVAFLETFIGLTLVTGRFVLAGVVAIGAASVGFFAPLVLFAGEMFADGPTIEAQYIFKDIVLASAALVVAAKARGAKLTAARA